MVWYGMVWYGMVWYGMVWYGMVLNGRMEEVKMLSFVSACIDFRYQADLSINLHSKRLSFANLKL
jgi:hypothetical protein